MSFMSEVRLTIFFALLFWISLLVPTEAKRAYQWLTEMPEEVYE